MKCFYHTDNDGKCAAFWVALSAGLYDEYLFETKFIPINYGMRFPLEEIEPNEQIYIVDYSIEPDEMRRLLTITTDVTWIDHHKSAIEKYSDFEFPIRGIRYDGVAGCMLTYCWLHHMTDRGCGNPKEFNLEMTKEAPMFTKYIADYDVWKFEYGDDTRYFNLGSQLYDLNPFSEHWNEFLKDRSCSRAIEKGKAIMEYRDSWAKEYCEHKGFETELEGYKCFALNLAMVSSDHFKSIDEDKYDMFVGFSYDGNLWAYSLRSSKIDCSEIAKKYGGGGHKGAAGFTIKDFIF